MISYAGLCPMYPFVVHKQPAVIEIFRLRLPDKLSTENAHADSFAMSEASDSSHHN